jgi:predicted membrane protein
MNKTLFGVIFIITAAIILVIMHEFGIFRDYIHIILIPLLMLAYSLGQFSERKYGNEKD